MAKKSAPKDFREQRKLLGLNQLQFWARVKVTQSGGSRFENGRNVSGPIQELLELAYGKNPLKTLAKLRGVEVSELTK